MDRSAANSGGIAPRMQGYMAGEDPLVAQCRTRVGKLISGKWRLDALIGVGGMAAVYMATHRNGNLAAVKMLHEEVSLNQEVRERFLREAYIANKVNHPGTVKVLDDDRDELGAPYIVMELLTGETVDARAQKSGGRLAVAETLDILDRCLAVLEVAHAQAIVHRDLKPENLFLTAQGELKVLDFGIARLREENQQRRTQTGLVMGTPAFMAPEQAMGRWSDVDARTDLWAMSATAFTLLTALPVHEAESAGEMLIAAATRPARSLSRVFPQAPFALVTLVDRGLAYERANRFPDATTYRAELAKVRAALSADEAALSQAQSPQKGLIPATVHGATALPQALAGMVLQATDDDEESERIETFDPSTNSDEEIARMAKFFALLERALTATKQYAIDHPEPKRRFDDAFRELAGGLMSCEVALAWNLTPYSFGAREQIIWEPESPWNRIPYQLFADGVRTMGFAPGLDLQEFMRWVHLITLDPTTDFAPEDDVVTLLWDENLEHVFFQSVDSFAEGNQDQRARYEAERARVIAGAHAANQPELAKAVNAERKRPGRKQDTDAASKGRELFRLLARGDTTDTEAAARVANLNITDDASDEDTARSLQIDATALALLSARMETDISAVSERFVAVAAEAFVVSARAGRSTTVTMPLSRAIDSLAADAPRKAVDMILELRDAVQFDGKDLDTETLRHNMTSEILSTATLQAILKSGDTLGEQDKAEYLKGVTRVLGCLQPQHFEAALDYLLESAPGELRELILGYLKRTGHGHEAQIGKLFATADVDLGLALVRLLLALDTQPAKDAIGMGSQSPHALVRIEALGHIEGAAGPRLRAEITKLLEDPDDMVRLMALQAMEAHDITVAGAFLVLRIQQPDFSKLPLTERRQALQTLSKLRAKRCEEVCIELLSESSLLRMRAKDETRELAAEFLGELATSDAALFLLESIATSSGLKNSKRVREAAQRALDRLKQRAEALKRVLAQKRKQQSMMGTGAKPTTSTTRTPSAAIANDNVSGAPRAPAETGTTTKPRTHEPDPSVSKPARSRP